MKIVVVGGKARSIVRHRGPLVRALTAAGHTVVTTAPDHELQMVERIPELGATFESIPLRRHGTNPLADANAIRALVALYRKHQPDLVFTYTVKPVIYGSIAAAIAGFPCVSLVTGLGQAFVIETPRERLVNAVVVQLYRAALRTNRQVIFQNGDDAQLFLELGILRDLHNVTVVNGSGVDMDHYARAPVTSTPLRFIWLGRLLKDKGLIEMVEAFRPIRAAHPDVELRVLGLFDEQHPQALSRATVEGWHDEGVITFLGGTDDVRPYIADASVVCLPSYREGTPRSVLEAMSMGRAVVTTEVPGCRQTVRHGHNGFLVKVKDVPSLRLALQRFVDDRSLVTSMGDAAYRVVQERYDVRKVNRTMFDAMGL
ncbi:MAG: glycosyltransferase involved in cell wall biosynthesis [Myxococcota bacterium]|jgi:glycosyltransferase involved in cell wall biosynthesis